MLYVYYDLMTRVLTCDMKSEFVVSLLRELVLTIQLNALQLSFHIKVKFIYHKTWCHSDKDWNTPLNRLYQIYKDITFILIIHFTITGKLTEKKSEEVW